MARWRLIVAVLITMMGTSLGLVRPQGAAAAPVNHQQLIERLDKLTDTQRVAIQVQAVSADEKWCPQETGFCVQGDFLNKWKSMPRGMFNIGLPLSEPTYETLETGTKVWVQYFERQRMELHPEAPPAYRVQFGLLGSTVLSARPAAADLMKVPAETCEYQFTATQRCISGDFRRFYEANGGLELYGYAITNATNERLEDGRTYWVQYFERGRFELHPEAGDGYKVQLGQFGRYYVESRGGGPGTVNNYARCLNIETTHPDPNVWRPITPHSYIIGSAWTPSIRNGDKPADFSIKIHQDGATEVRLGGKTWEYPWSCGPTAEVDFKQISFPLKGWQELLDLNLARYK